MEILTLVLLIVGGLFFLVAGGELLTLSASKLATIWGVRPIIIGLTVVAFGTSMPEGFVSIFAALSGKADIALANVIGSNIFNITLILGIAAMIQPLKVEVGSLRREVPFVVGGSILTWFMAYDRVISRLDGFLLLVIFISFLVVCFRNVTTKNEAENQLLAGSMHQIPQIVKIIGSLILLVIGAKLLVSGASGVATLMGVSELLIGLTIVAAGTSLPELATSILASKRGKDDIAVGNVTGSNVFNLLFILGATAIFSPVQVSDIIFFRDIPLMILTSLIAVPILKSGFIISRLEGLILVLAYVGYLVILIKEG